MSATYLLAHVSENAAGRGAPSLPSSPRESEPPALKEDGHADAVWCTKWAKLPGGDGIVVTGSADHTIKLWNPTSGAKPTKTLRPPAALGIVGLDVDPSPEGAQFLVSNSLDSVISRFSMDGVAEGRKELGPAETWSISLNPRSLHLATAGSEARVRILSSAVENFGEELTSMDATGTFGSAVEYSKDGRLLAVASDTGYVTLFDAETGQLVSTFPAHSSPIRSVSFTSSLLITGSDDKRINVFDLRALTSASSNGGSRKGQVASLGGHEGWVVSVEARNERLLASGSADGTIKLFDLASPGSALSTLRDHTGDVWSLAWAPESGPPALEGLGGASAGIGGGQLVSAGEDGKLRWWRGGG
ncbi:WD40-repeat-containing domain protein [Leucosporidium creatinivorum]|uniref:WD40-repeat-containing domain protein n=1 Tax=Leucosporidium creatinivorum TaxID=106004 RepID=A0A1Y2G2M7_9BASI|nr:WD40-repeat-containing domain protein [Leucosporidium creatinivorum]